VASNIHKKLVFGALGCGGLLVVLGGIGLLVERAGLAPRDASQQMITPNESAEAWDSLTAAVPGLTRVEPPVPTRSGAPAPSGFAVIVLSKSGEWLPPLGDTFPQGSTERKAWGRAALQVAVRQTVLRPVAARVPSIGIALFSSFVSSRVLLAAADDWSRHGDLPEAILCFDSALALGRAYATSTDLERAMTGARIERDAADLLSRDSLLAGGPAAADRARLAVASLDRFASRLRAIDGWILTAGATPTYTDSLAGWVADSTLPLTLRTAAVQAISMGWVFNPLEPGAGIAPARAEALRRLRESNLPDVVTAALDRFALSDVGLMTRFRIAASFRAERLMLSLP